MLGLCSTNQDSCHEVGFGMVINRMLYLRSNFTLLCELKAFETIHLVSLELCSDIV
jgi:hypothetical protein